MTRRDRSFPFEFTRGARRRPNWLLIVALIFCVVAYVAVVVDAVHILF